MRCRKVPLASVVIVLAASSTACGGSPGTEPEVSPVENEVPVAVAGPDQEVTAGATVGLDGSGSSDADGSSLAYLWSIRTRPEGSAAALQDSTSSTPSFTADLAGQYLITLSVDDGRLTNAPDTVAVLALRPNNPPVANAGADLTFDVGAEVRLDGSASSDPDGDPLGFSWTFASVPKGSVVVLSDTTSGNPRFTPDLVGAYAVRLVVSDQQVTSDPDTVTITATAVCVSNPKPVFTQHITDLSQLDVVIPPGSVSGDHISSHSYLGNTVPANVPVYAPVDTHLINGVHYQSDGLSQYSLYFRVSCEVMFILGHFVSPTDSIKSMFADTPSADTRTGDDFEDPPLFQAGELLGYTTGVPSSGRWDFGVYNTEHVNTFGNNARYEYAWRDLNSDCPYDYFTDPLRQEYYALFGTAGGTVVPGADCRGASQDVVGTASGAWFLDSGAEGDYGSRMAIAATLDDGQVRMGGIGSGLWINFGDATFTLPADITAEHCYFKDGTVLYLKVVSPTELMVYHESASTGCPGSFPSAQAKLYIR